MIPTPMIPVDTLFFFLLSKIVFGSRIIRGILLNRQGVRSTNLVGYNFGLDAQFRNTWRYDEMT